MKCETCRFWVRINDAQGVRPDQQGQCRAHPPHVNGFLAPKQTIATAGMELTMMSSTNFPMTRGSEWCGEYLEQEAREREDAA